MNDKSGEANRRFDRELADHRYRMRNDWHDLIEDLIVEARNEGAFDDLPGAGKRLNLKKSPYAPDKELAHALLKNNDLVPAWIMERNYLLDRIKKLRSEMRRVWERHERDYRMVREQGQRGSLVVGWDRAVHKWSAQIIDLNRKIDDFNLKRPIDKLEIFRLELDKELARVGARHWLKD